MPPFIKGLELSRQFYEQIVKPILDSHDPDLDYAAGLIGQGSEVLGYDDKMSTDHDWGPALTIFLGDDQAHLIPVIFELMRHELPHHFRGYATNFMYAPEAPRTRVMAITTRGAVNHQVQSVTIREYFQEMLAWDIDDTPDIIDWLTFPSQKLRALTSGAVFHDGEGDLTAVRATLGWYPDDLWLYLMAAQWNRIGEEEHLMGRAGYVGDELGAGIIASRIIHDFMMLGFLMEKQFAPYAKWFGTAFNELECSDMLVPILHRLQHANDWHERASAYAQVVEYMIDKHNQLNIMPKIQVAVKKFHNRPFPVADGGRISTGINSRITNYEVRRLFRLPSSMGSIDQFSDETSLKERVAWRERLRQLYTV